MNKISELTCVEHSEVTVWAIITLSTGKLSSCNDVEGSVAFQNCLPKIGYSFDFSLAIN